jgi:hypothetical protein
MLTIIIKHNKSETSKSMLTAIIKHKLENGKHRFTSVQLIMLNYNGKHRFTSSLYLLCLIITVSIDLLVSPAYYA